MLGKITDLAKLQKLLKVKMTRKLATVQNMKNTTEYRDIKYIEYRLWFLPNADLAKLTIASGDLNSANGHVIAAVWAHPIAMFSEPKSRSRKIILMLSIWGLNSPKVR